MTASDDFRSERPGPVDDRPAGSASGAVPSATPSRSDFPVRRGATAGRPVSRDEGLVGGRARFRSDRHRTWNARRDLLPGGRQVQVVPGEGPDDEPPPLPDDLRVDRLEVVRDDVPSASRTASGQDRPGQPGSDRYPLPQARTGWPAAPLPPTVATRGTQPGQHPGAHASQPPGQYPDPYPDQQPARPVDGYGAEPYSAASYPAAPYPTGAPAARPMPPSVARADASITRADLADLLPRQATPQAAPQLGQQAGQQPFPQPFPQPGPQPGPQVAADPAGTPPQGRTSGRRAASPRAGVPAPGASTSRPEGSTGAGPLDDLVPHPERVPYGVDLPTSADELFPPSTRQLPPDLLRRKPAGTSTGLQPRIFAPGTGTDESALPVLVGDPVAVGERPPADRQLDDQVDGVRRFDLTGRAAPPARPDPRLPVRPAPPADLDVVRAWGAAPQPAGAVGPSTGPLAAVTVPARPRTAATAARSVPPVPPTRLPAAAPSSTADVSDLATLFGPRPGEEPGGYPAQSPVRVGHARRPAVEQPARRGWVVPTITAALGLVAGIVFATSSEPAAAPTPARTVIRTVTVAPTP